MNTYNLKINSYILFIPFIFLIPIGWFLTKEIFEQNSFQYLILSVIAQISVFFALKKLTIKPSKNIHFWIIFIIILSGYFLKFYIYSVALFNSELSDFFEKLNPLLGDFMYDSDALINYFALITATLFTFTFSIYIFKPITNRIVFYGNKKDFKLDKLERFLIEIKIRKYLFITFLGSLLVLYLSYSYKIGIPGEEPLFLPFKLAGVINLTQKLLIPIFYLILVYLSDIYKLKNLNYTSILSYGLYALISAYITTSRAEIIFPVIVIFLYWIEIGKFKKSWIKYLLILIPIIIVFYALLGIYRQISAMGIGVKELFDSDLFFLLQDFGLETSNIAAGIIFFLGFFLRIQGADSLIYIMDYYDKFSTTRLFDILTGLERSSYLYTDKVLDYDLSLGTLFSPSLLGFFYMLFPSLIMVCFAIYIYTYFWHKVYQYAYSINKFMFPATIPFLTISLIYFTMEGTLEILIRSILIFLLASKLIKKFTQSFESSNI